ncbi:NHLP bacteriocin export ABC transporter permease/ATPase subunit [Candidatus Formimonas warabiya]|uniref:NHLP bacteriocin export ABC transporter permease/ATPase subunit n=1 Tax=Formimonas warabiya TaxID=1761012 RepID=A0A3G1KNA5_FORW1|nr:NHLP bacteriocin export ABC transporter permease/ATPase subunit [Candidatus Formimonas warabiya]ATW23938.1 NHLP bacteriocin export ABC transporter permease/ATPase subunit [Candidatus Formimonas warabiya]
MNFNIFDEQINTRRENDRHQFEGAFADLVSILGIDVPAGETLEKEKTAKSALEKILLSFGAKIPEVPESITELNAQFDYMLRPSGIMRRRVELVGSWWEDAVGALLGSTLAGDVIAIMPLNFSGYGYIDPKTCRLIKINKKTAKNISTDAFCFYRPLPAKKLNLLDLGKFMLMSISRADLIFVLTVSLFVSLLGMFLPFMNKQIFDSVIPSGTKGDVLPVAALLIGAAVGTALFNVTRDIMLSRFRDKISFSVQSASMMRLFSLPTTFFKDYSSGELSNRLMSIATLCKMISNVVLTTGLTALFSFVYIFQMGSYAPMLVGPGLLIIFVMLAFSIVTTLVQLKISHKRMKISAKLTGLVFALFSGVQKIKLAGAEKRAFAKWAALYKEEGKLTYSPPLVLRINSAVSVFITMCGAFILYYFAGISGISAADYIAFNLAYGAVSGAIIALASIAMIVANIKPLLEMVRPILETIPEYSENKKILTSLSGNIEVNNLTFRYTEEGPPILENVSFKIRPGEYIAVVGKTGCGKSTLMRLLLGFEKPETGAIYYDGHNLENLDLRSLRQCIGVDLQNGKLFSGDIFSNIIITAPWKTLDDAWEAARLAGMEEDIKAMPMGMHTMISEGSGGVSGGQRQRLLIARAIVSKPNILFFDEATSALDNITQKHVSDSLAALKCTRIVIAHRLSTIRNCDKIIVLDSGKIVEEGNYEALIAKQGAFYELAKRQMV